MFGKSDSGCRDTRILCRDPMYLREMARIAIKPLRIAFDHLGLRKPYEQAIRHAADAGLRDLSNYMLYNFHDSPADLFGRMRLNMALNEELGIRIFSFPMRYQPVTRPDRGHVGRRWNPYYLRSMQVVLQATHGVVSGLPDFFRLAYGDTYAEFQDILLRPHHYIRNRLWYEKFDGRPEFETFRTAMDSLSDGERIELLDWLCGRPSGKYADDLTQLPPGRLRETASFHIPISREREARIRALRRQVREPVPHITEEERVEDAALTDQDAGAG